MVSIAAPDTSPAPARNIHAPADSPGERERATAAAWYAAVFLTVAASLSTIDRQVLSLMIGPIRRDLHISDTQMGVIGGLAYTLLYTVLTLPAAWLADRGSRRAVATGAMFLWSVMTASCGLAQSFVTLFLARMGVGVGEAALAPASYSMLSDLFPKRSLPIALGLLNAAPFLGVGLANILGGGLVQHFETAPPVTLPIIGAVKSWQFTFILLGVPGVLAASIGRFTLKEPTRRGRAVGDGHVPLTLAQVAQFVSGRWKFLTFMFIAYICLSIQGWALFFWIVEFLVRERGLPRGQVGLMYGSMAMIFGFAGAILSGALAAKLLRRGNADTLMKLVIAVVLLLGPLAIVMPMATKSWQIFLLLVPVTFFMGCPGGLGTTALQFIAPNELKGRIIALYMLIVNCISLTLGPFLGGLISDRVFAGKSLGGSLSLMASVDYPVAIVCLILCLRPFRAAVDEARAWDHN
jgi:MFS family permease